MQTPWKILPINFRFSLSSKRKRFGSCNNPYLRLQQREIGAFLSSSGKTPARKTSGGVLVPRCCQSWAGHAVLPCCLSGTNLVNNPQQRSTDTTAVLLSPDKLGRRAPSTACFCRSALQLVFRKVSERHGGTCSLHRGARHLAACIKHWQGPVLEGLRAARRCAYPQGAVLLVFNYYLICCSVFLKPEYCFLTKIWFTSYDAAACVTNLN